MSLMSLRRNFFKILICLACGFAWSGHVAAVADPAKVVRMAFEANDAGFDMVRTSNAYSGWVSGAIYETLLSYDYLARPAKLIPKTVEAMPEIADSGKTYTFHLKKGIFFSPDPAFKGKLRELTAEDYIFTFKRVLDPALRSQHSNFIEGKIVGLDEHAEQAKKTGKYSYDTPVAGLQALDRYTLRVRLNSPDYNFQYVVAYGAFGAVAREVIEAYGQDSGLHPVGTGPYMLGQYVPNSKIVLVANPDYRGFIWDFESTGDAWDEQLVKDMRGKKMPQIGRVEINIIEEEQSRWLAFQNGQLDLDKLPQLAAPNVLDGTRLKPEFLAQNIGLSRFYEPETIFNFFNFRDPTVGGYSPEKIALRRAIAMIYRVPDDISAARKGQAIKAEGIIPSGVAGHDPAYRSSIGYDPDLANKLLDHFGYKRGSDGYRTLPDGKPLLLDFRMTASAIEKVYAEIWKRGLDRIGIRAGFSISNFADNLKHANECKTMIGGSAWHADFPDGENFMQLLYGANALKGNYACYESPTFDALYKKAVALPPGPERNAIYVQMNRQMEADTAWAVSVTRVRNWLVRPWLKGFKKHPFMQTEWQFLDVEKHDSK